MKIAMLCDYPLVTKENVSKNTNQVKATPVINLIKGLCRSQENIIHVITFNNAIERDDTVHLENNLIVHYLRAPRFSGISTFYAWRIYKIRKLLDKIKPDVVHGQGTEKEMALAAVTSKYPNVITVHGMLFDIHKKVKPKLFATVRINQIIENIVLKKAKNIICVSNYSKSLISLRSKANLYLIPNAIGDEFYTEYKSEESESSKKNIKILFVGNIYKLKGVYELVKIFKLVKEKRNNVKLTIVGKVFSNSESVKYFNKIQEFIRNSNLENCIEFKGWLEPDEVMEEMKKADLFIFPSKIENAPMVIAEASAVGLPVIANNVGGIKEMVLNGVTGYVVDSDLDEFSNKCLSLIENLDLRNSFSLNARELSKKYRITEIAQKHMSVYQSISNARDFSSL